MKEENTETNIQELKMDQTIGILSKPHTDRYFKLNSRGKSAHYASVFIFAFSMLNQFENIVDFLHYILPQVTPASNYFSTIFYLNFTIRRFYRNYSECWNYLVWWVTKALKNIIITSSDKVLSKNFLNVVYERFQLTILIELLEFLNGIKT